MNTKPPTIEFFEGTVVVSYVWQPQAVLCSTINKSISKELEARKRKTNGAWSFRTVGRQSEVSRWKTGQIAAQTAENPVKT
jgi:hypothetical protein